MRAFITGIDGSLGAEIARHIPKSVGSPRGLVYGLELQACIDDAPEDVDCLVLNDGTNGLDWIGTLDLSKTTNLIDINLIAPMLVLNRFVERRPERPMRVLFISSQTYRVPQRTTMAYCASKAGMVMAMKVAARELAPRGWIVNALAPGKIEDTVMSVRTDAQVETLRGWKKEEADAYALKLIPAGRFTTREEVARGVVWALSAPDYVNGAVLEMMGGA